jgi:hypothetical protein
MIQVADMMVEVVATDQKVDQEEKVFLTQCKLFYLEMHTEQI